MRIRNKLLTAGCIAASAAALLTGLSCNDHEIAPFSKSLAAGAKQSISSGSTRQVDILFVVDNSSSMLEEQKGLDKNFNLFLEQLIDANADFRLGVISTAFRTLNTGFNNSLLKTQAYLENTSGQYGGFAGDIIKADEEIGKTTTEGDVQAIINKCEEFFDAANYKADSSVSESEKAAPWIYSGHKVFEEIRKIDNEQERKEQLKKVMQDYFRCQFMLGTNGSGIERGLITTTSALENTDFKRKDSLLAIVFVTDENDCSDTSYMNVQSTDITSDSIDNGDTDKCETYRNIEDSCTLANDDYIEVGDDKSASALVPAAGQLLAIDGKSDIPSKTLREWCVQGDEEAQKVLTDCLSAYRTTPTSCPVGRYINCPDGECNKDGKHLTHRVEFFDRIVNEVATRNAGYYGSQNAALLDLSKEVEKMDDDLRKKLHSSAQFDDLKKAREEIAKKVEPFRELAKADIIVASIINRDRGQRYDVNLPEQWCGTAGTQGYRYQLFADMFDNDPIYAPICCMGDEPYYSMTETKNPVCAPGVAPGDLSEFGPVLGAIGRRIGEAVNTMCAEAAPITCIPEECEKGSVSCPCNHGCDSENPHMKNTDNQYYLCKEFEVKIGTIQHPNSSDDEAIADAFKDYRAYEVDKDFTVDYESNYCLSRTGSPIQIMMNKSEAGRDLIIEYPKKVSGALK